MPALSENNKNDCNGGTNFVCSYVLGIPTNENLFIFKSSRLLIIWELCKQLLKQHFKYGKVIHKFKFLNAIYPMSKLVCIKLKINDVS